jgi:hypothetical protein
MKNIMKSLIALALVVFVSVTITSCGDKSEDQTPAVSKPVWVGYWDFKSAFVTPKNGNDYTVSTLCTSKVSPEFNVEFDIVSDTEATQKSPCSSDASLTYKATITNGKVTSIEFKDSGSVAYIYNNIIVNESTKTITANQTFPIGNANSILVTFILK